ncbi:MULTISPECIES: hypothetical protein [Paraburkholderia]|uniref:hypothetical protein n=1 Tax=Paraburkholderia TaxID=1822464 RepID=UPI001FEBD00F|nr:hypothetical protein [Paraburkholderia youngii]
MAMQILDGKPKFLADIRQRYAVTILSRRVRWAVGVQGKICIIWNLGHCVSPLLCCLISETAN